MWESHDSSENPLMSAPPSRTAPSCGSQKRAASLAQVDFPLPDRPTKAVTCPSSAVKLTSRSTGLSP